MIFRCIKIHIINSRHREFRETRKYIIYIYIFGFYHVDNKRKKKMSVTIIMLSEDFSRRHYNNITMFPTTLIINDNTTIELIENILKSNIQFYNNTMLSINFYNTAYVLCIITCFGQ